jgi:hypothetical protein
MNPLLNEIQDCIDKFNPHRKQQQQEQKPTSVTFQKPKWNDLLLLSSQDIISVGISTEDEIKVFMNKAGKEGPNAFCGRMLSGLKIQFGGFGKEGIIVG